MNMINIDEDFAKREQSYIRDVEAKIENALSQDVDTIPDELKDLTRAIPLEITVDDGKKVIFTTVPFEIGDELYGQTNKLITLIESKGEFLGDEIDFNVRYVIYKMPEGPFYRDFFYKQIALISIAFGILSVTTIGLSQIFVKPLRKIRESIEKVSDYKFDELPKSDDAINKEFGDLAQKLESGIHAVSLQHTELETELQIQRERLNNSLSVSRSFIHDFKTPLHQLILENDFFISKLDEENDEVRELVQINNDVINRLMTNLNDVLAIMKDDIHTRIQDKELVSLEEVIFETVNIFTPTVRLNNLIMDVSVDEVDDIEINKPTLRLLIHNLVSNMVQYAQEGTELLITVENSGENVMLIFENESSEENSKAMKASEQIFNAVSDDYKKSHKYSSGNGLFLIKDLTSILSGTYNFAINNEVVKITIVVPKHPAEL
ncbi:hypothetical protein G7062_02245 [Erysipelothrix sp. HDW6C]|uniref:sensor histidine kinase n=1 Tax=Erysipelothrix sp. HDW6C TaxID=2714930 RepID=UPI00140907B7|nr:hypothetical protein [Erysipelothrix sp. HDW6C]QIK69177.1 hypothetical protein G7062_02245 [Erysipelothrix sp. HDW6C]